MMSEGNPGLMHLFRNIFVRGFTNEFHHPWLVGIIKNKWNFYRMTRQQATIKCWASLVKTIHPYRSYLFHLVFGYFYRWQRETIKAHDFFTKRMRQAVIS